MDINKIKSIHFVGIKGVAMTALAIIAKEMGISVSGSDIGEEFPTDKTLNRFRIYWKNNFTPEHISNKVDLVIYTGAHQGSNNIEVLEALHRKIPVLPHGKALGMFMSDSRGITVAGSHGKTTTAAIVAHILMSLGKDPSFAVGCGEINSLETSGHFGKGDFFVAEGDEYVTDPGHDFTPRFMWQKPEVLIITNIDFDHPDVYENLESVKNAFIKFANSLDEKAVIIVNTDDKVSAAIVPFLKRRIVTYGVNQSADVQLQIKKIGAGRSEFILNYKNTPAGIFTLRIPGVHNCLNAAAALGALISLGFKVNLLIKPLAKFLGTKRRFEKIAEKNGKLLFDDYAHHPVEIAATLKGCKEWFPGRRLILIFQPHTFSRTQALLGEFALSFKGADIVILTEIYASARERISPDFDRLVLYAAAKNLHPGVHFAPSRTDVLQYLQRIMRPNDLVLTMGAGDIFNWLPAILETF